jgi:hypothetical protein
LVFLWAEIIKASSSLNPASVEKNLNLETKYSLILKLLNAHNKWLSLKSNYPPNIVVSWMQR